MCPICAHREQAQTHAPHPNKACVLAGCLQAWHSSIAVSPVCVYQGSCSSGFSISRGLSRGTSLHWLDELSSVKQTVPCSVEKEVCRILPHVPYEHWSAAVHQPGASIPLLCDLKDISNHPPSMGQG